MRQADTPAARSLKNVELVPQGENLELQRCSRAQPSRSGERADRDITDGRGRRQADSPSTTSRRSPQLLRSRSVIPAERCGLGPCLGHFYEAACQVTPLFVGDRSHFGHTSNERAQPLQPARGVRARTCKNPDAASSSLLAERDSEVTHPFMRALRGTPRCRRTIRSEGGVAQSTGRLLEAAKCPSALTPPA